MERPNCYDYGFKQYEIPLIEEAHEKMLHIDDVPYSDAVLQGIENNYKRNRLADKVSLVLTWVIIALIAFFVIYKVSGGSFKEIFETAAYFYIILAAGGFIGIVFAYMIIHKIISSIVKIFIHGDKKVYKQRKEEEEKYKKRIEQRYGQLDKKYTKLQEYLNIKEEYFRWLEEDNKRRYEELKRKVEESRRIENQMKYSYWRNLQGGNGNDFEEAAAELLRQLGYKAKVMPIGADGGVDIIAEKNGKKYAIQCKAQEQKVPPTVARDLLGVVTAGKYDGGKLFTLNGVSANTAKFCEQQNIEVWDIDDFVEKSKTGVMN